MKMRKAVVNIENLVMDEKLYPRVKTSWHTALTYSQAMKTGKKFPPIVVGKLDGDEYLIDGWHRIQAYKWNKIEFTDADIFKAKDRQELFLKAIELNASHGRPFTFQEKVALVERLERMRISKSDISKMLGITLDKMRKIKVGRIAYSSTNKPVVLKTSVKHFAGKTLKNGEIESMESASGAYTQIQLLDTVTNMLTNNLFDINNEKVQTALSDLEEALGNRSM